MKSISLRLKIVFGWIAIVVVPLVIIGTMFFVYVSDSLESMTREKNSRVAENLAGMTKSVLLGELRVIEALSADPQIVEAASSKRYVSSADLKLKQTYAKVGAEYEGMFIADKNGVILLEAVDSKRIGINIEQRDYFQKAHRGMATIGDPVFSKATGYPIVVACTPIFNYDRSFAGVLAIALKIDFLLDRISAIRMGKTGYAFMLDSKGMVIAHPRKELILHADATRISGIDMVARRMVRQETGTERYTLETIRKMASFAPVNMAGWSIGVTQNRDELLATTNSIRMFYLICGGIFLVLTTCGTLFFSKSVSTPVQKALNTLNKAIEQSAEAFVIIGLDRKVQFVNPATERLTGYSMAELASLEPFLNNTNSVPPDEIWHALEQGNIWAGCINGINKDSVPFNLEVTITPVRDDKGAISGYLAIGRDITRELRMEAQLHQSQKMEAIGTLAGGIAHDFNNILSAIFGYAELTMRVLEDRSKATQYLQNILNAAERARELVGHILTFSRRTEREMAPIEPKSLIKEALKLLRASLPTTIEIQESMGSDCHILGDPSQLHQVIMNLCTNAAHAMREKGGVLKVALDDVDIDERFAKLHHGISPGRHLRLKVSDTGHGIAPENLERIFDPFFTTKPQGEGTGLGLSVVHGILQNFGGTITVYSEMGKGTEFTAYLPVVGSTRPSPGRDEQDEVTGGSERIMIVDDETAIITIETEMLESLGYGVEGFNDSMSALAAFRRSPATFDIVITDYAMPTMAGLDLAEQLKEIRNDIPIILCSGHFDMVMERRADELRITERLNKPVTSRELAKAVRKALESRPTPLDRRNNGVSPASPL